MLSRLYLKNFALIEEVSIEFGIGLNVITGETGAGKSILLGALNSILGGPATADLVRAGADRCTVEALFEFDDPTRISILLSQIGNALEDDLLSVRREILSSGRSRAFVNGISTPLKQLKELGGFLLDLNGQHEHQSLLDQRRHAGFLDDFGGLSQQAAQTGELYRQQMARAEKCSQLRLEFRELQEQEELSRFQLEEIRSLAPDPGEEPALEEKLRVLENVDSLITAASTLYDLLYQGDNSITERLTHASREIDRMLEIDAALQSKKEPLEAALFGIEDVAASVRTYLQGLSHQPGEMDRINDRLDALRRLKKKYGRTLEEVVAFGNGLERMDDRRQSLEAEIQQMTAEADAGQAEFAEACRKLSDGRKGAAETLSGAVEAELTELGMANAAFEVRFKPVEAEENGTESVEFYLSANPGEPARPLNRVASGGEISRIMLVLKQLIAGRDAVSTLVFDELDSGISGRVAAAVGRRLQKLSESHQTITITHLPQIASLGENHFSVMKRSHRGRTVTHVQELDPSQRTEEVANLLAGEKVSETARKHAEDMLE